MKLLRIGDLLEEVSYQPNSFVYSLLHEYESIMTCLSSFPAAMPSLYKSMPSPS